MMDLILCFLIWRICFSTQTQTRFVADRQTGRLYAIRDDVEFSGEIKESSSINSERESIQFERDSLDLPAELRETRFSAHSFPGSIFTMLVSTDRRITINSK